MRVVRERFHPDRADSREAMEALQNELAETATFSDDLGFSPEDVRAGDVLVAGIDQAFLGERAVSAIVVIRGEEVVEREYAVTPLSMPYVPGLLAFREGGPIIAALEALTVELDLLVFDGSGRIHYREAGIATHVGVLFDTPAIGVAKSLLCGRPNGPINELSVGDRVPIEADDSMSASNGTIVGYAYQSRQYPNSKKINPLYISAGHRLSAETAVDCVETCGGEYKLPRPTRLADQYAGEVKSGL